MLEAKNIKEENGNVIFALFIEDNHSSDPDVIVSFSPSSGKVETDRTLDYRKQDYVKKAVRKLSSYTPEYPKSFKMVWY